MTVARFWSKVDVRWSAECWPWRAKRNTKGYGAFQDQKAHRLAYEFLVGDVPGDLLVLHRCDNPPCCNPAHLFLGTGVDNVRDMDGKGRRRSAYGEKHPHAKLTSADVAAIRASALPGKELATLYGVASSTISEIRRYRWRRNG
jgi:hypothetical protein